MKTLKEIALNEPTLIIFGTLTLLLAFAKPQLIKFYPSYIDWHTILVLTGLIIITTGIEFSGFFNSMAKRILAKIHNQRALVLILSLIAALLSTFLTNDVTLFIVIPLILNIKKQIKNDLSTAIIFVALAVNVGSTLTPIGNPQNIILWHKWNISFLQFAKFMLPPVLFSILLLVIFIIVTVPKKPISFIEKNSSSKYDEKLFALSATLLLVYLIAIDMHKITAVLAIVIFIYLFFYSDILLKTDWILLLTFCFIFIDFSIISQLPAVKNLVLNINLHQSANVYLFSALSSQIISNVPASVFVSQYSNNWLAIAYGVNVGGNGLIIGSMANIIALRMAKNPKIWLQFHKYSLTFFFISLFTILLFIKTCI